MTQGSEVSEGKEREAAQVSLKLLVTARVSALNAQEQAKAGREALALEAVRAASVASAQALEEAVMKQSEEDLAQRELRREQQRAAKTLALEQSQKKEQANVKRLEANAKIALRASEEANTAWTAATPCAAPSSAGPLSSLTFVAAPARGEK